jgi:hypothetical protein
MDGIIVDRSASAVEGKVVDTTALLFSVADVSQMWLILNVREEDAQFLTFGQPVLFQPANGPREAERRGSVGWISTAADDQTRTVQVRVDLPNSDGRLRANTFGLGRVVLRNEPKAIVCRMKRSFDGTCQLCSCEINYLEPGLPKFFHVLGAQLKDGDVTEVIAGPCRVKSSSKNSVALSAIAQKHRMRPRPRALIRMPSSVEGCRRVELIIEPLRQRLAVSRYAGVGGSAAVAAILTSTRPDTTPVQVQSRSPRVPKKSSNNHLPIE